MILLYVKETDDINKLKNIAESFSAKEKSELIVEPRRTFSKFDAYGFLFDDIVLAPDILSFGTSLSDAERRISRLLEQGVFVFLAFAPATYKYGLERNSNSAAVMAIIQTLRYKEGTSAPVGRPKINLPENWETLYEDWQAEEISSAEFIKKSGLKRATFYNVLAEYKSLLKEKERFAEEHVS